jgi:hypothetical protein
VDRYAISFTVREGTEDKVAEILASYPPPKHRVDDETRLVSTSVFMHGTQVVRMLEIEGNLFSALAHLAKDPSIQAVERQVSPYLVEERDLDDPDGARAFFAKALMRHVTTRYAAPVTEGV